MTPRKLSERILAVPVLRTQPDRRLVMLAREGHEPAVEEIVRRYRPALLRYAASIVPPDRADDVVQDSLARALPGIGSGDADLYLRHWRYTIVRNTAFNSLRDAGPPHEHLDENYDGVEQPPQALERREELRSLLAGLQGLPGPQREALVKREMEGLSHADIGAQLGVSVGAARQLIFRARNALREGVGSLVPMPLLRQLFDNGGAGGAAVAGGSGAVAVKAAVAALATGAAVTAGVAIKESHHRLQPGPATVVERSGGSAGALDPSTAGSTRRDNPRSTTFTSGKQVGGETGSSLQIGGGDGHQSGSGGSAHDAIGGDGSHSGSSQGGSPASSGPNSSGSGDSGGHGPDGSGSSGQSSPSGGSDGGSSGGSDGPAQAATDGGGDLSSSGSSDSQGQVGLPDSTDQNTSSGESSSSSTSDSGSAG